MVRQGLLVFALAATLVGACGDDALNSGTVDGSAEASPDSAETAGPDSASDIAPDSSPDAFSEASSPDATSETSLDVATEVDDSPLGGARPAKLVLPPGYTQGSARPLLILLHGYGVSGEVQDLYLRVSAGAAAKGFIAIVPSGTKDATGSPFWNASPGWCCDFASSGVDDAGYLLGLVAEARQRLSIDPARIYLLGHSNGGFMSHKMACEHADVFAGIAAIAGSMSLSATDCAPSEPISVLQIHGTADATILYGGVALQYPGAETVVKRWAAHNGCELLSQTGSARDYDAAVLGDETRAQPFPGCAGGAAVELWEMRGSGHVPTFKDAFMPAVLDWLLAHPKTTP